MARQITKRVSAAFSSIHTWDNEHIYVLIREVNPSGGLASFPPLSPQRHGNAAAVNPAKTAKTLVPAVLAAASRIGRHSHALSSPSGKTGVRVHGSGVEASRENSGQGDATASRAAGAWHAAFRINSSPKKANIITCAR